jgi:hypothetical protein
LDFGHEGGSFTQEGVSPWLFLFQPKHRKSAHAPEGFWGPVQKDVNFFHERRKTMKRIMQVLLVFVFFSNAAGLLAATDLRQLIAQGIHDLGVEKGNPALCALTDAPYVKLTGNTAQGYVDVIRE